jgi:CheY-like chemotaxis protein
LESPHILVADPDDQQRAMYFTWFGAEGWTVIEATNGREALVRALTAPPSLIVADLRLPLIDGVSLCEVLRQDAATADVPFVVVAADSHESDIERVRRAGADRIVAKTDPAALLREAKALLLRSADVRARANARVAKAVAFRQRSVEIMRRQRMVESRTFMRTVTTAPPFEPPELKCLDCDAPLKYDHSYVGGVNARRVEQWDIFSCSRCGMFEYRHRSRKLRRAV